MMDIEERRNRLKEVFEKLKENGITQQKIADETGYEPAQLSEFKSGKIRKIPDEFLDQLHEKFHINPKYIRSGSNHMFDSKKMKLLQFEDFVESWNVSDNHYLLLKMDENFCEYLKEFKKYENEGFNIDFKNLMELYEAKEPGFKEYVLVPREKFVDIVGDSSDNYISGILKSLQGGNEEK